MIPAIRGFTLFLFFLGTGFAYAQTESKVFITKTGAKYHKSSCRYAETEWAATLSEAKDRGLTACLVCKPGVGASNNSGSSSNSGVNSLKSSPSSTSTPSSSTISGNVKQPPKQAPDAPEKLLVLLVNVGSIWGRREINRFFSTTVQDW